MNKEVNSSTRDTHIEKKSEKKSEQSMTMSNTDDHSKLIIDSKNEREMLTFKVNQPNTAIDIQNGCGLFSSIEISLWQFLQDIHIGDDCCVKCTSFRVFSCDQLKTISIGDNSFSQSSFVIHGNILISISVIDCDHLESIHIGKKSFESSDFLLLSCNENILMKHSTSKTENY